MIWREITADYAGFSFRAAGGDSLPFGQIQREDSPRLSQVLLQRGPRNLSNDISVPPNGGYSNIVASGAPGGNTGITVWGLRVALSNVEVRPRNSAVRIWIRAF